MVEIDTQEVAEPFKELAPHLGNTPVAPAHGIAAIALSMAMKYTDISTVQDGALYQQYKLEGKNFVPLDLHLVFDTAERIEKWLLGSSDRIAKIVVDAIDAGLDEEHAAEPEVRAPDGAQ
jgi:hypothetical protein